MRVIVTAPVVHLCPYVDERDIGTVEASWSGQAVELHAFAAYVEGFAGLRITHEELTAAVRSWLSERGGVAPAVSTRWRTAGLDVEVRA